jgi:hypothetical protein
VARLSLLADSNKSPSGLTIRKLAGKTKGEVFPIANSFYAQWRLQSGHVPALSDNCDSPPERLLQAVWRHQRLVRSQLRTLDGETIRVLHPGFVSREGGPDFRGAVVQFGNGPPSCGDVEIDVRTSGWRAHGHDRNPTFEKVILHVIWEGDLLAGGGPPRLALHDVLDAPVGELNLWLNLKSTNALPESLRGLCSAPLKALSVGKMSELLLAAAWIRFQAKAVEMRARARQAGWEQALWEGLFRALGYKHNTWPMQCLADLRGRCCSNADTVHALQARLFGVANLLPSDWVPSRSDSHGYLRRVWDVWWREREEFNDCVLPRSLWRFSGQRPANHPHRRLALAAHWLATGDLAGRIERWCAGELQKKWAAKSLWDLLQVSHDEFWSWHWTVRSVRLKRPQPLLGRTRVTDLAVNVILPWLWIRAVEGQNESLQNAIQRHFQTWPAAQDNSILRLARERLIGGASRRQLHFAAEQQGLLQIVRDFCDHSNAVCESCRFPELVRGWNH